MGNSNTGTRSASLRVASDTPSHAESFDAIVPGTSQLVSLGSSSEQSSALQATTTIVQLVCDTTGCFVAFGANPTAVNTGASMYIPANVVVRVGVTGGTKIAALQGGSGGKLYITEGA
jgi:hypothetical protein